MADSAPPFFPSMSHGEVQKLLHGPENRPSVFINFHVHCDVRLVENFAFATCSNHGGVFGHFVSIGIFEKPLFYCSGNSKMHVEHLQKTQKPHRQRFHSISSTCGPFLQCCHTHQHFDVCQTLAYVMRHDHWSVARKATWQHVFTGLPPIIYRIKMGQHLGAP